jgi:hypothetical protein
MKTKAIAGKKNEYDFMIVDENGMLAGVFIPDRRKLNKEQKAIIKAALTEVAKKIDELKKL